jgi:hypothetical protein
MTFAVQVCPAVATGLLTTADYSDQPQLGIAFCLYLHIHLLPFSDLQDQSCNWSRLAWAAASNR